MAVSDDAADGDAWYYLGAMLVQSGRYESGLPCLSKAQSLLPDSWAIYFYMGKAELLLDHIQTAVSLLESATRLNPDDTGSYYLLARAFRSEGHLQEATAALQRVAALHNNALDVERRALRDAGIVKDAGITDQP